MLLPSEMQDVGCSSIRSHSDSSSLDGHMCVGACMYQCVWGGGRESGQLTEVSSLLHHVGLRDETWVISFDQPTHLAGLFYILVSFQR